MPTVISASKLQGNCTIPPSKSQTMRALAFAGLSTGKSYIENFLSSPDTDAMMEGLKGFGVKIATDKTRVEIIGCSGLPSTPKKVIDVGNSGLAYRFLSAYAALAEGRTTITGDHSIQNNRIITPLLGAINSLGGKGISENGFAPICIDGGVKAGKVTVDGSDSQIISSLLILMSFLPGISSLTVRDPGETPFIEMTLEWMKKLDLFFYREGYRYFFVKGSSMKKGFSYYIPSDFSSLSFLLVAALITQSFVTIEKLNFTDSQGDKWLIALLQKMGANIWVGGSSIDIYPSKKLDGGVVDAQKYIDAVPILSVLGCFTKKGMIIQNASICRKKESDRLSAMAKELRKMQAKIEERSDGLIIHPSSLTGATVTSHQDHRIAMALSVAALQAKGRTTLLESYVTEKSFPQFFDTMKALGAKIGNLQ